MAAKAINIAIPLVVILAIICIIGILGQQDYSDALREQQVYCDNVQAGYWPDYNHNAGEVCK